MTFVIADGELAHGLVDLAGRLAVAALQVQLHLVGDALVALPVSTFNTAWVPTICDVGVTSGGNPKSSRTRGISANTSFMRLSAPCSLSWFDRFEIMPPGT